MKKTGKHLEEEVLGFPGLFLNRPHSLLHLINNLWAASLIYSGVIAGWVFLAFSLWPLAALIVAIVIFGVGFYLVYCYEKRSRKDDEAQPLYLAIRQIKGEPRAINEVVQQVKKGLEPKFSQMPEFIDYYPLKVSEEVGLTISVFKTEATVYASTREATRWLKQKGLQLNQGPLQLVVVEEALLHKAK